MAEQLVNNFDTTLASSYTAGAGSIQVLSATGLPTSGTYTLAIFDAITKNVKLLWRVTAARSGTTIYGAAEGSDVNANSGDLVSGTILSVASLSQSFNERVPALIPPVSANFSWVNQNGATEAHDEFGFSMALPGNNTNALSHRVTPITVPYTYVCGFAAMGSLTTYSQQCVTIRDAGGGKSFIMRFGQLGSWSMDIFTWIDPANYQTEVYNQGLCTYGVGPIFTKIVNDGVNRTFYVAPQRAAMRNHWIQLYQTTYNSFMTDSHVGVALINNTSTGSTMMDVVHFSVT